MSVPESQRGEGKFNVLVKARDLASYTIKICINEKVFLPEYQHAITDEIMHEAKEIFIKCWTANNIKVKQNGEGKDARKRLQEEACLHCNNLLALMQIAQQIFHLKSKRIRFWGTKTIEVRNLIRAWIESDRKRSNSLSIQ